jgi:hypothetical protein
MPLAGKHFVDLEDIFAPCLKSKSNLNMPPIP